MFSHLLGQTVILEIHIFVVSQGCGIPKTALSRIWRDKKVDNLTIIKTTMKICAHDSVAYPATFLFSVGGNGKFREAEKSLSDTPTCIS